MKKTLLVIGDLMMSQTKNEPSLSRLLTYKARLEKRNIGFVLISYDDLLNNRLPDIIAKRVKVMLFFPYNYWNSNIERYDKDKRIYGDMEFGSYYKEFFLRVSVTLRRRYREKDLSFINPPISCALDRDKVVTHKRLTKAGIASPHIYRISNIFQVEDLLKDGKRIYVKPRFGAMGKGITYLNGDNCYTNFLFKKGEIISHSYDYNWKANHISTNKRDEFLKILIKKGFIFQEAIETPIVRQRKFDIRVYVINKMVPYMYAKSAPRDSFITNWSQGGRIEKGKDFLHRVLGRNAVERVKAIAKKAARQVNLNFAGVDVIVNRDMSNIYLLEIQSFPGYERGFDLMKFLVDTI